MNETFLKSKLIVPSKIDNEIFISFVIPTYNRLDTLKETIKSIVPNNKFNYEIVITDNTEINKTTETKDFILSLDDNHISYYVNEKNYGMVDNWNVGLIKSRGKYVAYIHDDDMIDKKYFDVIYELLFQKLKGSDIGFIKSRFDNFSSEKDIKSINVLSYNYRKVFKIESILNGVGATTTPSCGILFNREVLLKISGFNSIFHPCADHIVGFDILDAGYSGFVTEDIIGHYRWGINETLKKETLIGTVEKNFIIREYFYSNNLLYKLYGFFFKNLYYTRDVHHYLHYAEKFEQNITIGEMVQRKNHYIENNIIYSLLDFINKIFVKAIKFVLKILS